MIVNLVEFDKSNVDLIEMLKKYSKQNCRDELDIGYVSTCLKNMYKGFSFYNDAKPVAFICLERINNKRLYISVICSIKNTNNLGTQLLSLVFDYTKDNNYNEIILECEDKLEIFYKKFGFFVTKRLDMNFIYMMKTI